MKRLFKVSMVALVVASMAFAFTACNSDEGSADATTAATTTAAATTTQAEGTTVAQGGEVEDVPSEDVAQLELLTSPDGQARVYRDFTAANLNFTNQNPHQMSASTDFDALWFTRAHLIRRNQTALTWEFLPEMAAEMPTISADGTVWTFTLRQGMQWSTGTPINAHCFDYSLYMLLHPNLTNRNATTWWVSVQLVNARAFFLGDSAPEHDLEVVSWEDVGFRVIDDYTIEFTFESRPLDIVALQAFAGVTVVYRELYEAGMNADRTETTYSTGDLLALPNFGPFRFAELIPDQFKSLERNDDFINAWQWGREIISWRNIEMPTTREQMFLDGHIDREVVTATNYYLWREDPRTFQGRGGQPWSVYINTFSTEVPALTDVNFRRALYFAIDRVELAHAVARVWMPAAGVIGTQAIVGDALAGDSMSYRATQFGMDAIPPNYGFNPELALEYFELAFSQNNYEQISFFFDYFEGQDPMRRTAEILQQTWESLFGSDRINVNLRSGPPTAIYDSMRDHTIHMGIGSQGQSNTNIWASWNVHTPYGGSARLTTINNEELNEWFRRTTEGDLVHAHWEERAYALMRMEQLFLEYMPMIPLFQNSNWQVFSGRTVLMSPEFQPAGVGFVLYTTEPMAWEGAVLFD